ncbi:MAG: class I SAM-dependent methyltransferase [Candidatus Omnitrophota bacterium]
MSIDDLMREIEKLPVNWHGAGSFHPKALRQIVKHTSQRKISNSLETGTGKSTLLLSHISQNHKVFTVNGGESLSVVRSSPLFNRETVEFIEGSTQVTLPRYDFRNELQLVILDGPHGYPFPDLEYYYVYPHLQEGGVLILDDIHIPTICNLFRFLKEDAMFRLSEVVKNTAFFIRTGEPVFDPFGDGWWLQNFNRNHFPANLGAPVRLSYNILNRLKKKVPASFKDRVKKAMKL